MNKIHLKLFWHDQTRIPIKIFVLCMRVVLMMFYRKNITKQLLKLLVFKKILCTLDQTMDIIHPQLNILNTNALQIFTMYDLEILMSV